MKLQVARYLIFSLFLSGCANLFGDRVAERSISPQEFSAVTQQSLPLPLQFSYPESKRAPQLLDAIPFITESKYEEACIALQRGRTAHDTSALAALHIWCLLQNQNLSIAEKILKDAVNNLGVDQHLAYVAATVYEKLGDNELAHSLYSDLFVLSNDNIILLACARTALASSQPKRSLDCLDRLLLNTEVTSQHLSMRAAAYAQLDRHSEAMALLVKMLYDWPSDAELLRQTALVAYEYAEQGSNEELYEDAVTLLQKLVAFDPQFAHAHLLLARCYVGSNAFNEAQLAFSRCIEIEPSNVAASHELSDLYLSYNDPQAARKVLMAALNQPISASDRQQTNSKLTAIN
ncbi:MAG: tetratricopeptide repeat protein [Planctomycetes bacterium]|nr:tetratricopeptide repeat protein [Planctomycetota bacterium]